RGGIIMIQDIVWYATLVLILAIAALFIWVAISAKKPSEYAPVVKKWYKARSIYGVLLVILMLVITIYTLRELPFNKPAHVESADITVVQAEAFQFGFDMDETEFKVGDTVEFRVDTRDVTHGFGIYDPDQVLIAQTMAMPEYTNNFFVTF